jgi:hypothetical protein
VLDVFITQTSSSSVILPSIEYQRNVLLHKDFFDDLSIRKTFANFHTPASTSFIKASNKASLQALHADKRLCCNIENSLKPLNRSQCFSFINQQHYHISKPFTEESITYHGEFFSMAEQPLLGKDLPFDENSRSYSDTPHSIDYSVRVISPW